ncbi:hypothetical protein [Nonomuraea insulae]|uniref:Uncharacterized protein n=1 Tax=Nonomuraea insulae TaxID=1616787 RepID=A0ABW1DAY2_9ACTN
MNPTPGPARRRRLLAIAAAVTVIGGGGFLAVHPALAGPCDLDAGATCLDEDALTWEEPTGESDMEEESGDTMVPSEEAAEVFDPDTSVDPSVQAAEGLPWGPKINAAIDLAAAALRDRPACDNAVSGPAGRASRIFAGVVGRRRIVNLTSQTDGVYPDNPAAVSGNKIFLYRPWLTAQAAKVRHRNSGVSLGDDGWRTVILLHELGHLTGSLSGDHFEMPGWESRVLVKCLR